MTTLQRFGRALAVATVCVALLLNGGVCRAQFVTVISAPPSVIGDEEGIGSNTQLNVFEGGVVGHGFRAGAGSQLNIFGGTVGRGLNATAGAQIHIAGGSADDWTRVEGGGQLNISGGTVGSYLRAFEGGQVNLSGGSVGTRIEITSGAQMTISGGEFRLDGTPIEGFAGVGSEISQDIPDGAVLSGTLADGTPFAFSSQGFDEIAPGTLTLKLHPLPSVGPDRLIASTDAIGQGIRQGQMLVVDAGSVVGNGFNVGRGSTLIVDEGGAVGRNLEAVAANIQVNGGSLSGWVHVSDSHMSILGSAADSAGYSVIAYNSVVNFAGAGVSPRILAYDNSQVLISGGMLGIRSSVESGSQATLKGGSLGRSFEVRDGGQLTIAGGTVGLGLSAHDGGSVYISGGTIGSHLNALRGSQVTLAGGDFRINSDVVDGLDTFGAQVELDLSYGDVLSGVFSDGTPFAFGFFDGDSFASGTLTLESTLLPAIGPSRIVASTDPIPPGIRQGQTLIVDADAAMGDVFTAIRGSTVIVEEGGVVGSLLEAVGADVEILGGAVNSGMGVLQGSRASVSGGTVSSISVVGSELTISDGSLGWGMTARRNSQVMITGGSVGELFKAYGDSQISISGGSIGGNFDAYPGSRLAISGGALGNGFQAHEESRVTVSGGEFRLDGTLVEGFDAIGSTKQVNLPRESVLSGVLADGTPFAFAYRDRDRLADGTLTLKTTALPAIGPARTVASRDAVPLGVREGQTLVVDAGGIVGDHFNAGRGSTVLVQEGGEVGDNLEAINAGVTITGGTVGSGLFAANGSQVTISGGSVAYGNGIFGIRAVDSRIVVTGGEVWNSLSAYEGSDVSISHEAFVQELKAYGGSRVDVSGGSLRAFEAYGGSHSRITGGVFQYGFRTWQESRVTISGAEFYLDGDRIDGLESDGATIPFDVPHGALFSGVFADGTPFAFTLDDNDHFEAGSLTLQLSPLPPIGPQRIVASTDAIPAGIRQGQTLLVDAGGVVPEGFRAGRGSTVIVEEGGVVNNNLEAVGADVRIKGGTVNNGPEAFDGTHVAISGGSVKYLRAYAGSHVEISGGIVRASSIYGGTAEVTGGSLDSFYAQDASRVTVSGGSFADLLNARPGSKVKIAGGVFDGQIHAWSGSHVSIVGTGFTLGGLELDGLVPGKALIVEARDVSLEGILADGNPFRLDLSSSRSLGSDLVEPGATLSVTLLVPEPAAYWLACFAAIVAGMMRMRL